MLWSRVRLGCVAEASPITRCQIVCRPSTKVLLLTWEVWGPRGVQQQLWENGRFFPQIVNDPMKRDVPSRSVPVPCAGIVEVISREEEEGSALVMSSTIISARMCDELWGCRYASPG